MKTITIKHQIETEVEVPQVSFYEQKKSCYSMYYAIIIDDENCTVVKISSVGETHSGMFTKSTTTEIPSDVHEVLLQQNDHVRITEEEFRAAMEENVSHLTTKLLTHIKQ